MSRSKPPRGGTGRAAGPARPRRARPDLAAAVQAAAPFPTIVPTEARRLDEAGPDATSDTLPPETDRGTIPPREAVAAPAALPAPDASPLQDIGEGVAAMSLSMLDLYRQAAETQLAFWATLLRQADATPRRDDEAA